MPMPLVNCATLLSTMAAWLMVWRYTEFFLAIRLMLQELVTCNTCESKDGKIRKL